jgi:hypothetical protein
MHTSLSWLGPRVLGLTSIIPRQEWDPNDRHVQRATKIFNVPSTEVTPEMRQVGKETNFWEAYGFSPDKVAQGLTPDQAELKIDEMLEDFDCPTHEHHKECKH